MVTGVAFIGTNAAVVEILRRVRGIERQFVEREAERGGDVWLQAKCSLKPMLIAGTP